LRLALLNCAGRNSTQEMQKPRGRQKRADRRANVQQQSVVTFALAMRLDIAIVDAAGIAVAGDTIGLADVPQVAVETNRIGLAGVAEACDRYVVAGAPFIAQAQVALDGRAKVIAKSSFEIADLALAILALLRLLDTPPIRFALLLASAGLLDQVDKVHGVAFQTEKLV
jgi:hypothetical protein